MSGTGELEAQLAFVEDALQTLDAAMASQQQQILRLEQQTTCSILTALRKEHSVQIQTLTVYFQMATSLQLKV